MCSHLLSRFVSTAPDVDFSSRKRNRGSQWGNILPVVSQVPMFNLHRGDSGFEDPLVDATSGLQTTFSLRTWHLLLCCCLYLCVNLVVIQILQFLPQASWISGLISFGLGPQCPRAVPCRGRLPGFPSQADWTWSDGQRLSKGAVSPPPWCWGAGINYRLGQENRSPGLVRQELLL